MSNFKKFPSIEPFHNVYRAVRRTTAIPELPLMYFRPKIKIHGTNAGIRVDPNGNVTAQKRTSDIEYGKDNCGFDQWVRHTSDYWAELAIDQELVFFGEWAGPGIQNGVAANKIPGKYFFIYAILLDGDTIIVSPELIEHIMMNNVGFLPANVRILPWQSEAIEVDFKVEGEVTGTLERIEKLVEEIDKEDPYIFKEFQVSGCGEGLVYVPCSKTGGFSSMPRDHYSEFIFKVKGESHQQARQKKSIQLSPEVSANVLEFVDNFVTESRCQGNPP